MPSPKSKIFKTLAILLVLAFLIIKFKGCGSSLRIVLTDSGAKVLNSFHVINSQLKKLIPFASLREENKLLRNKINLLTNKIDEARAVFEENKRLKEILEFAKTAPYATIPAQVIGRDPTNWSNSLIINKGSSHGIRQNRAVLSSKGLIGRVVEVGASSSKISLITDPSSKVGVLIERNRQGGILTGRPDGQCRMIYISLDSDVRAGDRVETAGIGSIFPKRVLVGVVVKVDREPARLYKYAIVKPSQDLSKLEEVLCIR